MHLLELSRKPAAPGHTALENGILNPRLSLQGRSSVDGWPPSPGANFGHSRRSSRTNPQHSHAALFDAFEDVPNGSAHGLHSLREEDAEDDELEAATERTRLRKEERRLERSHSGSPVGSPVPRRS
jgi:hypothetical protein